ncbi:MAG: hypothetical protein WC496_01295 [Phycisphaerae bacterium]|jgi:hypothetical protein
MNWKVILSVIVVGAVVFATGCQFAYDFWPAEISPLAVKYAGREPNSIKWYEKNLRTAGELKNEVIDIYIGEQLRLDYLANLNKEKYQQVIGILDLSIKQAQADRMALIGTLDQPGWLLTGLLTLLPVGSYVAGWRTLWPNHYTEQEVQAEIAKIKNDSASVKS